MSSRALVLVLHRRYRHWGGEESFLHRILLPSLERSKIPYKLLEFPAFFTQRKNLLEDIFELVAMTFGLEKLRPSYWVVKRVANNISPSHVIFNNAVPALSLDLPKMFKSQGLKTFLWLHNTRLACANGLFFNGTVDCKKCLTHSSWFAFWYNCNQSFLQSLVYACSYRSRRVPKKMFAAIGMFVCNSDFTKNFILSASALKLGIKNFTSVVVPMPPEVRRQNPPELNSLSQDFVKSISGLQNKFYLYVGRVSYEKGVDRFIDLSAKYPDVGFVICSLDLVAARELGKDRNNIFVVQTSSVERDWLYGNCAALIIASRVKETSSLVISESQAFGTPVVYPSGGGAQETALRLGRTGCTLEEFNNQSFEYTKSKHEELQVMQDLFDDSVRKLVS